MVVEDELTRHAVQVIGDGTGLDVGFEHIQAIGGQLAGHAHAGEALRPVELDRASAVFGFQHVGHGHRWFLEGVTTRDRAR